MGAQAHPAPKGGEPLAKRPVHQGSCTCSCAVELAAARAELALLRPALEEAKAARAVAEAAAAQLKLELVTAEVRLECRNEQLVDAREQLRAGH